MRSWRILATFLPSARRSEGRIVQAYGGIGDTVRKGQVLFTVASADLTQAASTLLSTYATEVLTTNNLARSQTLHADSGLADKDLEQAVSDQATADAAYKAARATLRVFGLSDADIHQIQATHAVNPVLPVTSPIDGVISAREAQPGLFVQPGNVPAPFTVSNTSLLWMVANVPEDVVPHLQPGQAVSVSVDALPGVPFSGHVKALGQTIDPSTHTDMLASPRSIAGAARPRNSKSRSARKSSRPTMSPCRRS